MERQVSSYRTEIEAQIIDLFLDRNSQASIAKRLDCAPAVVQRTIDASRSFPQRALEAWRCSRCGGTSLMVVCLKCHVEHYKTRESDNSATARRAIEEIQEYRTTRKAAEALDARPGSGMQPDRDGDK
jgi:Iap family predicted aminopeptidase